MKKIIFTLSLILAIFNSTALAKNWVSGSKKSFCAKVNKYGPVWNGYDGYGNELSQIVIIPADSSGWDPSLNIIVESGLNLIVVVGKTPPQVIQKFKTLQQNSIYKITGIMRLGEVMRFPTMDVESIVETPNCH